MAYHDHGRRGIPVGFCRTQENAPKASAPLMAFFIIRIKEGFMLYSSRMRAQALVASLLMLFLIAVHASADSRLTKIADNVYAYVDIKKASPANSFGANAGIVVGRDGVVVIDTLISVKEAQRFIKDIRKITDKPIRYVINTHYHLDHVLGNAAFVRTGAVVISHAEDQKNFRAKGESILKNARKYGLTEADMEGTVLAYPQISFTDRMEIDLGDLRVQLISAKNSHTGGSLFVFVPERNVVFAGDVLFTGYHPYMAEGDLAGWTVALDALAQLKAAAIVPGHGPVSSNKDITDMKEYIVLFDREARRLSALSNDPEFLYAELKKVLPNRPESDFLIRANIQRYSKGK